MKTNSGTGWSGFGTCVLGCALLWLVMPAAVVSGQGEQAVEVAILPKEPRIYRGKPFVGTVSFKNTSDKTVALVVPDGADCLNMKLTFHLPTSDPRVPAVNNWRGMNLAWGGGRPVYLRPSEVYEMELCVWMQPVTSYAGTVQVQAGYYEEHHGTQTPLFESEVTTFEVLELPVEEQEKMGELVHDYIPIEKRFKKDRAESLIPAQWVKKYPSAMLTDMIKWDAVEEWISNRDKEQLEQVYQWSKELTQSAEQPVSLSMGREVISWCLFYSLDRLHKEFSDEMQNRAISDGVKIRLVSERLLGALTGRDPDWYFISYLCLCLLTDIGNGTIYDDLMIEDRELMESLESVHRNCPKNLHPLLRGIIIRAVLLCGGKANKDDEAAVETAHKYFPLCDTWRSFTKQQLDLEPEKVPPQLRDRKLVVVRRETSGEMKNPTNSPHNEAGNGQSHDSNAGSSDGEGKGLAKYVAMAAGSVVVLVLIVLIFVLVLRRR